MSATAKTFASPSLENLDKQLNKFLGSIEDQKPKIYFSCACTIPPIPPVNAGLIVVEGKQVQATEFQVTSLFSALVVYQEQDEPKLIENE